MKYIHSTLLASTILLSSVSMAANYVMIPKISKSIITNTFKKFPDYQDTGEYCYIEYSDKTIVGYEFEIMDMNADQTGVVDLSTYDYESLALSNIYDYEQNSIYNKTLDFTETLSVGIDIYPMYMGYEKEGTYHTDLNNPSDPEICYNLGSPMATSEEYLENGRTSNTVSVFRDFRYTGFSTYDAGTQWTSPPTVTTSFYDSQVPFTQYEENKLYNTSEWDVYDQNGSFVHSIEDEHWVEAFTNTGSTRIVSVILQQVVPYNSGSHSGEFRNRYRLVESNAGTTIGYVYGEYQPQI